MRFHISSIESLKRKAKHLTCLVDDLPLNQCHEVIAHSLGYRNWHEMLVVSRQGLPPSPLDDVLNENELFERAWQQQKVFASEISLSPRDAEFVWAELSLTASHQLRKTRLGKSMSPWGIIQEEREDLPGIREVHTAGHGGYQLSAERQAQLPEFLRIDSGWYEEDDAWCRFKAVLNDIPAEERDKAREILRKAYPDLYEYLSGEPTDTLHRPPLADLSAWGRRHPDVLYPIAAWHSGLLWRDKWGRDNEPKLGFVVVSYMRGQDLVRAIMRHGNIDGIEFRWKVGQYFSPAFNTPGNEIIRRLLKGNVMDVEHILKRPCKFETFSESALSASIGSGGDELAISPRRLLEIAKELAEKQVAA